MARNQIGLPGGQPSLPLEGNTFGSINNTDHPVTPNTARIESKQRFNSGQGNKHVQKHEINAPTVHDNIVIINEIEKKFGGAIKPQTYNFNGGKIIMHGIETNAMPNTEQEKENETKYINDYSNSIKKYYDGFNIAPIFRKFECILTDLSNLSNDIGNGNKLFIFGEILAKNQITGSGQTIPMTPEQYKQNLTQTFENINSFLNLICWSAARDDAVQDNITYMFKEGFGIEYGGCIGNGLTAEKLSPFVEWPDDVLIPNVLWGKKSRSNENKVAPFAYHQNILDKHKTEKANLHAFLKEYFDDIINTLEKILLICPRFLNKTYTETRNSQQFTDIKEHTVNIDIDSTKFIDYQKLKTLIGESFGASPCDPKLQGVRQTDANVMKKENKDQVKTSLIDTRMEEFNYADNKAGNMYKKMEYILWHIGKIDLDNTKYGIDFVNFYDNHILKRLTEEQIQAKNKAYYEIRKSRIKATEQAKEQKKLRQLEAEQLAQSTIEWNKRAKKEIYQQANKLAKRKQNNKAQFLQQMRDKRNAHEQNKRKYTPGSYKNTKSTPRQNKQIKSLHQSQHKNVTKYSTATQPSWIGGQGKTNIDPPRGGVVLRPPTTPMVLPEPPIKELDELSLKF